MAADAIPGVASASETPTEHDTTTATPAHAASVKSVSKSIQKRPQTARKMAAKAEIPGSDAADGAQDGAAPQPTDETHSSHLDMLAETVRAIVTRVMQPDGVPPMAAEAGNETSEGVDDGRVEEPTIEQIGTQEASAPRSEYSLETRQLCVDKHAAGQSYKAIAEELKMPVTTVQTIVKRVKEQGGVVVATVRAGRPRVTNEEVEATILEVVAQNPGWTAREVQDKVLAVHANIAVSFETIRRRVRDCKKQLNTTTETVTAGGAVAPSTAQVDPGDHEGDVVEGSENAADASVGSLDTEEDHNNYGTHEIVTTTEDVSASDPMTQSAVPGTGKGKARRKRGSEYTPEMRELCWVKHERDGKSYHAIAEELNIPPDSVRAIVRKAKKTGTVESAPRSGRPRKTTDLIDRVILQSVKNSERSTAKQIQDDLRTIYQVKVSVETIRRRVRDHTKQRLQLADSAAAQTPSPAETDAAPVEAPTLVDIGSSRGKRPSEGVTATGKDTDSARAPAEQPKKRQRAEYSVETREKCVELHRQGMGYRKIGDQLDMPHTTVRAIVEKVLRTGSALPAPRSGRPRKTDEILDKVILQTVKMNSKCSARIIQEELESCFDVKVSCETIRRRVKDYMRQKHLFADSVEPSTSEAREDTTAGTNSVVGEPVVRPVTNLQLQQSMFGMTSSSLQHQQLTQPYVPIQHGSMADTTLRGVPQSLMEMMTAAAAAAAVVTSQHQQPTHHQLQNQQHQLPLTLLPMNYPNTAHAFGLLHSHSLHQSMDTNAAVDSQPSPTPLNDFVL